MSKIIISEAKAFFVQLNKATYVNNTAKGKCEFGGQLVTCIIILVVCLIFYHVGCMYHILYLDYFSHVHGKFINATNVLPVDSL